MPTHALTYHHSGLFYDRALETFAISMSNKFLPPLYLVQFKNKFKFFTTTRFSKDTTATTFLIYFHTHHVSQAYC